MKDSVELGAAHNQLVLTAPNWLCAGFLPLPRTAIQRHGPFVFFFTPAAPNGLSQISHSADGGLLDQRYGLRKIFLQVGTVLPVQLSMSQLPFAEAIRSAMPDTPANSADTGRTSRPDWITDERLESTVALTGVSDQEAINLLELFRQLFVLVMET